MEFRYSPQDENFRQEVRRFFDAQSDLLVKVRDEEATGQGWGPYTREFLKKAGEKGYLAPSWPKKYGGLDASYLQRHIVAEETSYYAGRIGSVALGIVGHVLLHHGTEQQQETFLPSIARGEIEFALGLSEPQAGSDLAALSIRAVRQGNHYVINGQKTFNTATHYSVYHWLAAKTNPPAKHRGISLFIVDLKMPGITVRPLIGMGKVRTNEVFYDDVKVPVSALVGEENKAWDYIIEGLAYERTWPAGEAQYELDQLLDYVRHTKRDGRTLAEDPVLRQEIGQVAIGVEISRLFAIRTSCMINKGKKPTYEPSMNKMFGSESGLNLSLLCMKAMGPYSQLDRGSRRAVNNGRMGRVFYGRSTRSVLTGGTNEVQRNNIASQIGLPRG